MRNMAFNKLDCLNIVSSKAVISVYILHNVSSQEIGKVVLTCSGVNLMYPLGWRSAVLQKYCKLHKLICT